MRNNYHNKTRYKNNTTKLVSNQIYNKFISYKYHTRQIRKLCNTRSTVPSHKFKRLMRHFHQKDPNCSSYKKSIISFFMTSFDKINKHDLISILWLFCHLHSSNKKSLQRYTFQKYKNNPKYNNKLPVIKGLLI